MSAHGPLAEVHLWNQIPLLLCSMFLFSFLCLFGGKRGGCFILSGFINYFFYHHKSDSYYLLLTFFLFVYWSPLCPQPDLPALEVGKTSKVATVPKISSAEPWNYRWPPQKWLLCQIKSYSEKLVFKYVSSHSFQNYLTTWPFYCKITTRTHRPSSKGQTWSL